MADVVHEAEAQSTEDGLIWFVIVFGVIGAITMIIVGAIIPERVGAWWIYAAALVGFIALGWWAMGNSSVKLQLVDDGDGLRLVAKGKSVNLDERLEPGYQHWATGERVPLKLGGGVMMHFSLTVKTAAGRTFGFRQMGGSDAGGWPERGKRLTDGVDVFSTVDIFGLQRALAKRDSKLDGRV